MECRRGAAMKSLHGARIIRPAVPATTASERACKYPSASIHGHAPGQRPVPGPALRVTSGAKAHILEFERGSLPAGSRKKRNELQASCRLLTGNWARSARPIDRWLQRRLIGNDTKQVLS